MRSPVGDKSCSLNVEAYTNRNDTIWTQETGLAPYLGWDARSHISLAVALVALIARAPKHNAQVPLPIL